MLPRPGLSPFDYVRPTSRAEVTQLLLERREAVRLLMGGTDLLVRIRDGAVRPQVVLDLKHLPGIREIQCDAQAGLSIGAAATLNEVARCPAVVAHYPLLAEAASSVASYPLRNRATLGGNLCNASPAADTAPATLVLEGRIVAWGPSGEREIAVGCFFLGPGRTALQEGEFVTAVRFPAPPPGSAGRYLKLGRNRAGDLSIVGVAVLGFADRDAPSGYRFRIALASVAPTPLRAPAAEEVLATDPPGEATFARAAEAAMAAARPISDVRASAAYRRAMVRNMTWRAVREVWGMLEKGA